jgi:ABC-type spermidine/putrescine transport system permease subunit II
MPAAAGPGLAGHKQIAVVKAVFRFHQRTLLEAAQAFGATRWQVLRQLPLAQIDA